MNKSYIGAGLVVVLLVTAVFIANGYNFAIGGNTIPALPNAVYSGTYVNQNAQPIVNGTAQQAYSKGIYISNYYGSASYSNYTISYLIDNCNYNSGVCPNSVALVGSGTYNLYLTNTGNSTVISELNAIMQSEIAGINTTISGFGSTPAFMLRKQAEAAASDVLQGAINYNMQQVPPPTTTIPASSNATTSIVMTTAPKTVPPSQIRTTTQTSGSIIQEIINFIQNIFRG